MLPHLLAAILALFSLSFVGGAPQGQGIIIRPSTAVTCTLGYDPEGAVGLNSSCKDIKGQLFACPYDSCNAGRAPVTNFDFTNCKRQFGDKGYVATIEVISFYADNPTSELHVFGNEPQHRSPGGYLCSPKNTRPACSGCAATH
ncbi:hypothetical protein Pst134EA_024273 [Puccinia striiformis f. sp. tritici]|uniref:uncharacterized protein n=1 Tax=Puccinia striiformis f. sp. tritici TaxID=168172 RepID=UPI0020079EA1|nr:uncharacterized protein Pst134EA_031574 [Puccinia striiformis f. sp. tritici]XP_047800605.1 hypothetical protein Pst134EA_024273 [Puccinia striiformis f. sp. tritici]KAI9619369.1 hypothetical protein KEM48_006281 [Puccinia striiformis f. sp. tritici PST-130]KAH9442757.1 hypothetical protein Pst134EA_031574 [Puccinia striiformis f. sp. tritici]KAH9444705.1 hypothetical protein Pst134EB_024961 [Puccinia striiformis f. sp. tritici]KAH9453397.1 hypothetical protein Pst134EA_024273 [Puccinia str